MALLADLSLQNPILAEYRNTQGTGSRGQSSAMVPGGPRHPGRGCSSAGIWKQSWVSSVRPRGPSPPRVASAGELAVQRGHRRPLPGCYHDCLLCCVNGEAVRSRPLALTLLHLRVRGGWGSTARTGCGSPDLSAAPGTASQGAPAVQVYTTTRDVAGESWYPTLHICHPGGQALDQRALKYLPAGPALSAENQAKEKR